MVEASIIGDRETLKADSFIPLTMAIIYLLLFFYFKSIGGYRAVHIDGRRAAGDIDVNFQGTNCQGPRHAQLPTPNCNGWMRAQSDDKLKPVPIHGDVPFSKPALSSSWSADTGAAGRIGRQISASRMAKPPVQTAFLAWDANGPSEKTHGHVQ